MEMIALVTMTVFFAPLDLPKGQNVFPDTQSIPTPYVMEVTVHSSINECRNTIKGKLFDIISDLSAKLLPTSDGGYGKWYQIKEPVFTFGAETWRPEEALLNFDVGENYSYPYFHTYGVTDGRLVGVNSLECRKIKVE